MLISKFYLGVGRVAEVTLFWARQANIGNGFSFTAPATFYSASPIFQPSRPLLLRSKPSPVENASPVTQSALCVPGARPR